MTHFVCQSSLLLLQRRTRPGHPIATCFLFWETLSNPCTCGCSMRGTDSPSHCHLCLPFDYALLHNQASRVEDYTPRIVFCGELLRKPSCICALCVWVTILPFTIRSLLHDAYTDLYSGIHAYICASVWYIHCIQLQVEPTFPCSGLYPQLAVADENNSWKRDSEQVFHTKVCWHCNITNGMATVYQWKND